MEPYSIPASLLLGRFHPFFSHLPDGHKPATILDYCIELYRVSTAECVPRLQLAIKQTLNRGAKLNRLVYCLVQRTPRENTFCLSTDFKQAGLATIRCTRLISNLPKVITTHTGTLYFHLYMSTTY